MKILAVDPGCKQSAYVCFNSDTYSILDLGFISNEELLAMCQCHTSGELLAIEYIEGFGMTAGQELFDTCFWSGRFCEAFLNARSTQEKALPFERIGRKAIKIHLCGSTQAKDKDIRESLIYRFGHPGTKSSPGRLYGISGHGWSALAVATYQADKINNKL